jgi:hypothetical protein
VNELFKGILPVSLALHCAEHYFFKQPFASEWKKHCFSSKRTMNVTSKRAKNLV